MTGERWEWHRVASHLKIPVSELQERLGYSEFLDWIVFLDKTEIPRDVKQEYYLAQIAAECRKAWVAHPNQVKLEDMILKLPTPEELTKESRIQKSKAAWGLAANMKLN